jgi:uncharacterized membrane protein HdeD (DUF308 family)
MGLIGLVRGDVSGSVDLPLYEVAGFAHTPLLGMIEIAAGSIFLVSALSGRMSAMLVAGAVTVVAGVVVLIEESPLSNNLVIADRFAWLIIAFGALAMIAAAGLPTLERFNRRTVDDRAVNRSIK